MTPRSVISRSDIFLHSFKNQWNCSQYLVLNSNNRSFTMPASGAWTCRPLYTRGYRLMQSQACVEPEESHRTGASQLSKRKHYLKRRINEIIIHSPFVGIIRHNGLNAGKILIATGTTTYHPFPKWCSAETFARVQTREASPTLSSFTQRPSHCAVVSAHGDMPLRAFHKLEKHPKLEVVAALMHERFLDISDISKYADLPDLVTLRGQLVLTLQQPTMLLNKLLSINQSRLVYALKQHAMSEEGGKPLS
eukprot:gene2136-8018_t